MLAHSLRSSACSSATPNTKARKRPPSLATSAMRNICQQGLTFATSSQCPGFPQIVWSQQFRYMTPQHSCLMGSRLNPAGIPEPCVATPETTHVAYSSSNGEYKSLLKEPVPNAHRYRPFPSSPDSNRQRHTVPLLSNSLHELLELLGHPGSRDRVCRNDWLLPW